MGDEALSPVEVIAAAAGAPLPLTGLLERAVLNLAAVGVDFAVFDLDTVAEAAGALLPSFGRSGGKDRMDMRGVVIPIPGTLRVGGRFPVLVSVCRHLLSPQCRPKRHWGILVRVRLCLGLLLSCALMLSLGREYDFRRRYQRRFWAVCRENRLSSPGNPPLFSVKTICYADVPPKHPDEIGAWPCE